MESSRGDNVEPLDTSSGARTLEVVFEVELANCSCPLSNSDERIENVHSQICDGVCHAEVTIQGDGNGQVVHATNRVGEACLCLAFNDVGCVPRIKGVSDDVLLVETYLSDRSVISELVDRINAVAESVSLRRLTSRKPSDSVKSDPTTIDLSRLTAKQREAATLAVSEGYYETPRQTTLDELSNTLGISKSAFSERLSIVESKLATAAFDP
ncbi:MULTISPECIES: helix-turn-helix domain-containing protein [Haloferax]|uniref:Transcriptional regulator n=1 Tax=Haloferax marinum TaxID=2666143 RepID=A0A6A8G8A5_9EURY|nr:MULTISPECIES: helix-turn-helix domain-containing protein [Haloferax]KAB1197468.1 transcriptional regulator [Haloferax sp. CBA1150]MRW96513.1 transcriptional regulator [Haloferax marinum]